MLAELFAGNKDLFKDTWIGRESDYPFEKHPVLSFSFSQLAFASSKDLQESLMKSLIRMGHQHNSDISSETRLSDGFINLVQELSKQGTVAILVDEYDALILAQVNNEEKAKENQALLVE